MNTSKASRTIGSRLLEIVIWVMGGILVAPLIAFANPVLAYVIGTICVAAALFVFFGKVSLARIGNTRAAGLIWLAFLLLTMAPSFQLQQAEERRLAVELMELRENDPQQYLARIRVGRGDRYWLSELRELDPEAFRAEVERRQQVAEEAIAAAAAETAEAERERLARQEAARAAAATRELQQFVDRLERAESDIERPVTTPASIEDVVGFTQRVGRYSSILSDADRLVLESALSSRLDRFRGRLITFQRSEFPRVRDAVGPVFRRELWVDNGSARTIGAGYRTIEFTNPRYILNQNIQTDFQGLRESLLELRFNEAVFREYEGGPGARFNLRAYAPGDEEIVVWRGGIAVRVDAGETVPTTPSLTVNGSGDIGRWSADCGVPCEISLQVTEAGQVVSVWSYSDGTEGQRPLGAPTISEGAYRFPLTDETGVRLREYIVVTDSGELTIYDRIGETMTGALTGEVDFSAFNDDTER